MNLENSERTVLGYPFVDKFRGQRVSPFAVISERSCMKP
jgi:hypothetical protein